MADRSSRIGGLLALSSFILAGFLLLQAFPPNLSAPVPKTSPADPSLRPAAQVSIAVAEPKRAAVVVRTIEKKVTVATSTAGPTLAAPAGTELHTVAKGESLPAIIHAYLPRTRYMTGSELEAALRQQNPDLKGIWPKPGTALLIPGVEPQPVVEKPVRMAKDFEVKAVYLTGVMAGSQNGMRIVQRWREAGGNAVVFDIKDSDGLLSINFDHPLAPKGKSVPIRNLPKYTRYLHSLGLHAIARIAIFRDEHLVVNHPELAVQSRRAGTPWRENGKLVWTDPSHKEVQDYDIALAKYAAESGADEIQFDYVRFPAEGDQKDATFVFEKAHPGWTRADVIADFLQRAHSALQPKGVLFSLDVFGVMAWQRPVDLSHTGQDIVRMAQHCDVLSPMIYPSHFFGMDGYALPGDAPEHFIGESMERFQKITAGSSVVLRPWLQAFGWKTKTYSVEYIMTQVRVSNEKGGIGFLFWNARNDYGKPFGAMPLMTAERTKYFHVSHPTEPQARQAVGGE